MTFNNQPYNNNNNYPYDNNNPYNNNNNQLHILNIPSRNQRQLIYTELIYECDYNTLYNYITNILIEHGISQNNSLVLISLNVPNIYNNGVLQNTMTLSVFYLLNQNNLILDNNLINNIISRIYNYLNEYGIIIA